MPFILDLQLLWIFQYESTAELLRTSAETGIWVFFPEMKAVRVVSEWVNGKITEVKQPQDQSNSKMGDHLGSTHFVFSSGRDIRQIRQISQILLISLNLKAYKNKIHSWTQICFKQMKKFYFWIQFIKFCMSLLPVHSSLK